MAVLCADAVGYSALAQTDELMAARAVDEAFAIFRQHIELHSGRVLNLTGDGIVAAFISAVRAVRCALDIQNGIAQWRLRREADTLPFRIGMTVGEVMEMRGNAFGDCINIAAKIQGLGDSGAVLISANLYEAVRIRSEFGFEYLGAFHLKNITGPADVYRVYDGSVAATLRPSHRTGPARARPLTVNRSPVEDPPTIAVLPLKNMAGRDQDFFADGVTEDIISSLTRFRGIGVIARGSVFAFKDSHHSPAELGEKLGARYVAQGTIRMAGKRLRVTVELSDTSTSRAVWSERYDRSIDDIFEIQDEITALVVSAMAIRLERVEQDFAKLRPPKSLDAYGLVLRAQSHIFSYAPQANALARSLLERAISLAPDYARALAALSRTHSLDWRYAWSSNSRGSLDRATDYAMEAVGADQEDARGHAELGFVQLYRREHERSISSYRRALSINPNDANIIAEMADALTHAGRASDAIPLFEKAMRLNPYYPDQYLWDMAGALMLQKRFNEAIESVMGMNNIAQGRRILVACYAHLGMLEEAKREADLVRLEHPGFNAEEWARVVPEKTSEGRDLFVSGLKLAGL